MRIDGYICTACEACVPYCPVRAISMEGDMAVIDQDECVDCGVCRNSGVCSVDCIIFEETPESLSQDFVVLIVPAMAGK